MANTHTEFLTYLGELNLTPTQEERLQTARDALITKIKNHFKDEGLIQPDDESQGSYILGTQNRPINEDFDLDHGIYLKHYKDSETPSVADAQNLVKDAVRGHTSQQLGEKDACVRVRYAKQGDTPTHHIDLAVYRVKSDGTKFYAHAKDDWQPSDQTGFKKWYRDNKTEQMHRLVRYFKGWADNNNGEGDKKLPSGFHLTVLAIYCAKPAKDRDDQTLVDTAAEIVSRLKRAYQLGTGEKIRRPVTPGEDLFKNYPAVRLSACIEKFEALVAEGRKALQTADSLKAQQIWQAIFGRRFNIIEKPKNQSESCDKFPPVIIAPSRGAG
ncbi:MAG: hypothetical protein LV481_11200 [Methylacidiphilales bacterium]|nr:hypothetical protein [Candidatus Methylacidiphilales bacterium]